MTDLQRRVLVEAEFLFYLVTQPAMFVTPPGDPHSWVSSVPTPELQRINAVVRDRLRGGSLAVRPPAPIRVQASNPVGMPGMVQK